MLGVVRSKVLLVSNFASRYSMQKSVKTDMLFIIVTSAKVESGKLGTGIAVAFGPFRALSSRQLERGGGGRRGGGTKRLLFIFK